ESQAVGHVRSFCRFGRGRTPAEPAIRKHDRISSANTSTGAGMLRTGREHLETLRDGRVVYVGGERIDDVTRHPAFREAARTVAGIYDLKADPAHRAGLTYEEEGG